MLITVKTAKLAKKIGFKENCLAFTDIWGHVNYNKVFDFESEERRTYNGCDAPDDDTYLVRFVPVKSLYQSANTKEGNEDTWWDLPTQSELQKWLREVHNIHISIIPEIFNTDEPLFYFIKVQTHKCQIDICGSKIYEESLEEGLLQALKLINL